jgi:Ca-activated chloride channel family protein
MSAALGRAFAQPTWLALLMVIPTLAVAGYFAARRRRQLLARLGQFPALRQLTTNPARLALLRDALFTTGLTFLCVAMAVPRWGRAVQAETATGRDIVIVLDLSRSMLARDVLPNRAARAQAAVGDLLNYVQKRGRHRIGLVAFAANALALCPLTHDYDHVRAVLAELDPAQPPPALWRSEEPIVSGTRIGAGIKAALGLFDDAGRGFEDIILLSDGDDPAGDDEWQQGVAAARAARVPIHAIGLGDPDRAAPIPDKTGRPSRYAGREITTRLVEEPLERLASSTGGLYMGANTSRLPLDRLFRERIEPAPAREQPHDFLTAYRQHAEWFYAAALLLIGLPMAVPDRLFRFSARRGPIGSNFGKLSAAVCLLALFGLCGAALMDGADLLIHQGNLALRANAPEAALAAYAQAEDLTDDPGLVAFNKGLACYAVGRYEDARKCFECSRTDAPGGRRARSLLGLGNALVQLTGDVDVAALTKAIGCFEECLAEENAEPEILEQARHNLELARLLLPKVKAEAKARHVQESEPNSPAREDENRGGADNPQGDEPRLNGPSARRRGPSVQIGPGESGSEGSNPAAEEPRPGKGNLPPIADSDTVVPLTGDEADQWLRQAAERIEQERLQHRQGNAPKVPANVKNW